MQTKILWIVLIMTNVAWFVAFQIVDKGRVREISSRQSVEQQRDSCENQVGKLTDAMSKLCACGESEALLYVQIEAGSTLERPPLSRKIAETWGTRFPASFFTSPFHPTVQSCSPRPSPA